MVEFDKSQKVPGKADQNLKEINFIIWRKFTARVDPGLVRVVGLIPAEEMKFLEW